MDGWATGSRVTGVTTNPKKTASFGLPKESFVDSDLDITLVTSKNLNSHQMERIKDAFFKENGIKLGITNFSDLRQVQNRPNFGRIPF